MVGSTVDAAHLAAGWGGLVQSRKEVGLLFPPLSFLFSFSPSCVLFFLTFSILSFKNHLLSPLHVVSTLSEPGDKMMSKISTYCLFGTSRQWKNQIGKLAITVQCNRFSDQGVSDTMGSPNQDSEGKRQREGDTLWRKLHLNRGIIHSSSL